MQAGQYTKAFELVETMLNDNDKFDSKEPETLANLYFLGGEIYREVGKWVESYEAMTPKLSLFNPGVFFFSELKLWSYARLFR